VEKQVTSQYFPLMILKNIRVNGRVRGTIAVCVLSLISASLINGQAQPKQSFHAALDAEPTLTKAADYLWASVFTHCGDSLLFIRRGRGNEVRLIDFKEPVAYDVQEDTLTRADKLNGIQARGTAQFNASAARWIDNGVGSAGIPSHRPQWSALGDGAVSGHPILTALGLVLTSLEISMTRKSGHWELSGENLDSFSDEAVGNKFACETATTANPFATDGQAKVSSIPPPVPRVGQFICQGTRIGISNRSDLGRIISTPVKIVKVITGGVRGENYIQVEDNNFGYIIKSGPPAQDSCPR